MEKDLFMPIKKYFEAQGYEADGEVKDIDLYMEKDGKNIAVELKLSLDFKAFQQAALRQKVCDCVYIGIPAPRDLRSRSFNDKIYILKRLGIGLITVSDKTKTVSVVSEPVVSELKSFQIRNKGKRAKISKEFNSRVSKSNVGGVNKTKIVSNYREDALLVLNALCALKGEATTKEIHKLSKVDKTAAILRADYYGWFTKKASGVYAISDKGFDAIEEYENVLSKLNLAGRVEE